MNVSRLPVGPLRCAFFLPVSHLGWCGECLNSCSQIALCSRIQFFNEEKKRQLLWCACLFHTGCCFNQIGRHSMLCPHTEETKSTRDTPKRWRSNSQATRHFSQHPYARPAALPRSPHPHPAHRPLVSRQFRSVYLFLPNLGFVFIRVVPAIACVCVCFVVVVGVGCLVWLSTVQLQLVIVCFATGLCASFVENTHTPNKF